MNFKDVNLRLLLFANIENWDLIDGRDMRREELRTRHLKPVFADAMGMRLSPFLRLPQGTVYSQGVILPWIKLTTNSLISLYLIPLCLICNCSLCRREANYMCITKQILNRVLFYSLPTSCIILVSLFCCRHTKVAIR